MPFDPDTYLNQSSAPSAPTGGFDPDAYLAKTPKAFDPDAYLGIKKPEGPGILEYGKEFAKQIGLGAVEQAVSSPIAGMATSTPQGRELQSAIEAIQGGADIDAAVRQGTESPTPPVSAETTGPYQTAQSIRKATEGFVQPSGVLNPVVQDIARGLGSVAGSIVSTPFGGPILAAKSEAVDTALKNKATPAEQEQAAQLSGFAGVTDFADLLLATTGSSGHALGLIKRVGKELLEKAAIEGGQEGLQQFIQNLITKHVYKPDQDVFEDVPYNAFIGAVVGGGIGGVSAAVRRPGSSPEQAQMQDIMAAGEGLTLSPVIKGIPVDVALGAESQPLSVGVPLDAKPQTIEIEQPPGPTAVPEGQVTQTQQPQEDQVKDQEVSQPGPVNPPSAPFVLQASGPAEQQVLNIPWRKAQIVTNHSTTLGSVLPSISAGHLAGKPVNTAILNRLKTILATRLPSMPIHFVADSEMKRAGYSRVDGLYLFKPGIPGQELPNSGPILISSSALKTQERGTQVILHEATHALTSMVMHSDPLLTEQVRSLMDVAQRYIPKGALDSITYGFTNEREFIAEAFGNPTFQDFLHQRQTPQELKQKLGLEGKPTLWQSFVEMVRRVLGMPKTPDTMSLLESTIRTGLKIVKAQERHIADMQRKFNSVEPELNAVIRQEETGPIYDMISGLNDHMTGDVREELSRQAGYADKMNVFYRYMLHAFQLGELNPKLAPLQRYLEKMRAAAVDESKWNDAAMRVMKDWENIGRGQSERLVDLIDDLTNMVYRTAAEVKAKVGRKPTQAEFQALVRKYKVGPDALQVLTKVNTLFDGFLDASSQLAIAEATKITDLAQRAKAIQAIQANVTSLKSRPYFPFMRYGRHVVVVKNAAGHIVHREHFERRGLKSAEAFQKEALARAQRAFPSPQYTVELDLLSESAAPMVGMSNILLSLMDQKLNLTNHQKKALEQLRFELSPAESYQHRFQHKSYVKGYSRDFQRSFAQYFFHGAKWYAKVKYADQMRQDIADVKAGTMTSLTPTKRLQLTEFMNDHLEKNFLNPSQDFISFKAGLVFFTLAYVPASAVVNMSQTPMVSLPFLAGKFGPVQAGKALTRAITNFQNYYRKGNVSALTSNAAKAMEYAIQTGRLDQTLAAELAAWGQGSNLGVGYGGGVIRRNVHGFVQKGMWMFSIAEKWNRRVAFMAARELALAQPNNKFARDALTRYHDELANMLKSGFTQEEASAILVASHVVDQTQFMATPEARPRFMRGKFGTLFLYKRFIQGLLFLTANNKRDFAPYFIVMALALGGLGGVPGYEDIKEIAKALGWWLFGKDFDLDREVRKLVKEITDESWAPDQVLHGMSRIGFGVPWLLNMLGNAAGQSPTVNSQTGQPHGPDLSASMSNTILPVKVGKLFGPPTDDPSKAFGESAAQAGGVIGGLAYNMYKSMASKDSPGDFKRWELAMPRAAKDLSRAYRAYSEGTERGSTGAAIIRYDTRDPEHLGEILGLAGGFQPRRLTAKWEEIKEQSEVLKFYDVQRGMILQQWTAAVKAGREPEEMEKMRLATQEFNNNLPYEARGMKLSSDTIQDSIRTRLRSQELQEGGLSAQRGKIPIIQEIQRLHPEAIIDVRKAR